MTSGEQAPIYARQSEHLRPHLAVRQVEISETVDEDSEMNYILRIDLLKFPSC